MGSDIGLLGLVIERFVAVIGIGVPIIALIVMIISWLRKRG